MRQKVFWIAASCILAVVGLLPLASSGPTSAPGAHQAPQIALLGRQGLFLAPHAGLLEVLTLAQLGEDTGLLTLLLEPADRDLDRLVLLDSHSCHIVADSLLRCAWPAPAGRI